MSDAKTQAKIAKDIVDREMVIGPNDTEAVQKFFDHFDIKMPKELKQSMDEFKKNPNLKTQKKFVIEVNRAISGQHSIDALDEMFKPIVECAKETVYELEFGDEITEMLGEDLTPQESQASLGQSQTSVPEVVAETEEPSDS